METVTDSTHYVIHNNNFMYYMVLLWGGAIVSVSALRKSAGFFSLTVLALSLPVVSSAGTVYYLQTGHTGSQTFINTDNATDWYAPNLGSPSGSTPTYNGAQLDALHTTFAWDLGGANILIKEGPSTSDTITFALWQGGLTGQEVAWVSWTAAQVCDYKVNTVGDACSSFGTSTTPESQVPLYFTDDHTATGTLTPFEVQPDEDYLAVVSSTAATGNTTYFIKFDSTANSITITDPGGNAPTDPGAVPEPGTWISMLIGCAGVSVGTRWRFRRS
jgi:hypothetical protein